MIIDLVLIAVILLFMALALDILLVRRRHPWLGWLIGLLPILIAGSAALYPLLTCKSDNPVGCEWSGFGVLVIGGLTIITATVFSLMSVGVARAHRPLLRHNLDDIPYWRSFGISLGIIALIAATAAAGSVAGWGAYRLVQTGIFTRWQYQGTPPDMGSFPGEHAVAFNNFDLGRVQVVTSEGRIFETRLNYCSDPQRASENCWWYGSSESAFTQFPMDPEADPACGEDLYVTNPPGQVIERVTVSYCRNKPTQTIYILQEDGSVWAWHHESQNDVIVVIVWMIGGALAGMFIGVLLGTKSKNNRKSISTN